MDGQHVAGHFEPDPVHEVFGGPVEQYEVPEYVTALLGYLGGEIERVESNRRQESVQAPIGWDGEYTTGMFTMRRYWYVADDVPSVNFEADVAGVGTVGLRWYKHLGRGMSCDRELSSPEWVQVFDACLNSVRATEPAR